MQCEIQSPPNVLLPYLPMAPMHNCTIHCTVHSVHCTRSLYLDPIQQIYRDKSCQKMFRNISEYEL